MPNQKNGKSVSGSKISKSASVSKVSKSASVSKVSKVSKSVSVSKVSKSFSGCKINKGACYTHSNNTDKKYDVNPRIKNVEPIDGGSKPDSK